jgi:prepilin-type N-terminal cleavage/methylation domain-containing protein
VNPPRTDVTEGPARADLDSGMTLIEILIAIVLMGTVVLATLGALGASVLGGELHRDHSNGHAWLQSAADALYAADKQDCDTSAPDGGKAAIIAAYQPIIDGVPNPEGWSNSQIKIIDLQFWDATDSNGNGIVEYRFGPICQDSINLSLQRITVQVRSPSGRIVEQVEFIK